MLRQLEWHEELTRSLFSLFFHMQKVGAYQEVLGSLHNLYGDTNAVHVDIDPENEKGYTVNHVIKGDTTDEVLRFMQYDGQVRVR